ncbi:MAG: peptidylprolyl isomerase [Chitinivibrionales bacterium]|nr:peptidylprolyl isomerase [Chitinivibrionales bacterium]
MSKAKEGDTVKVQYTGKLEDGTVFDQNNEDNLLEFTIGEHKIIPGFEQAVVDMEEGETKTVSVSSENAYGPYNSDAVIETTRSVLPENLEPELGQRLQAQDKNGNPFVVRITDMSDNTVTLDGNHPLAGKNLNFEISLKEVVGKE